MSLSVRPTLPPRNVCALKQLAAQVALGDGEGDLLADLGVEAAAGEPKVHGV
jgi:hypothetical protein